MNKNTKAMLTLLAATSITSITGITSFANTKFIDTNVSAKQFNEAIEAKIREEANRAAEGESVEDAQQIEEIEEVVETEVAVATADEGVQTVQESVELEVGEEATGDTEVASKVEVTAEVSDADANEVVEDVAQTATEEDSRLAEEIVDVYVAPASDAVVSSGFIVSRGAKTIDTSAEANATSEVRARAKGLFGNRSESKDLVDGPDNTPAETYAAPIFSTGKMIISGSTNHSIITDSNSTTSKVSDAEEEVQEQQEAQAQAEEVDSETNAELRNRVAAYASGFANGVGKYRYGGTNPYTGADCSGFVQHVLAKAAGVGISRTSASQAGQGRRVGSIDEAKAGDLLFYAKGGRVNHVGIYLGNGKVISASSPSTGMRITAYNYRPVVGIRNVLGD